MYMQHKRVFYCLLPTSTQWGDRATVRSGMDCLGAAAFLGKDIALNLYQTDSKYLKSVFYFLSLNPGEGWVLYNLPNYYWSEANYQTKTYHKSTYFFS